MSAMVLVRPSARLRGDQARFVRGSLAAARTRAASSGLTVGEPFMTLDTVARETPPAASATRLMVAVP